jgi:hypothetical protein
LIAFMMVSSPKKGFQWWAAHATHPSHNLDIGIEGPPAKAVVGQSFLSERRVECLPVFPARDVQHGSPIIAPAIWRKSALPGGDSHGRDRGRAIDRKPFSPCCDAMAGVSVAGIGLFSVGPLSSPTGVG